MKKHIIIIIISISFINKKMMRPLRDRQFGKLGHTSIQGLDNLMKGVKGTVRDKARKKNEMTRAVLSLGKNKPDAPQCAIVVQVLFPKNEFEARHRSYLLMSEEEKKKVLAPVGVKEDYIISQGELVYCFKSGRTGGTVNPLQRTGNKVSDIYGFSCVNGLPRDTQLMFVGWIATNNDTSSDVKLNQSTVQVVGTCTAINTGPYPIAAMSAVYFDEQPYAIYYDNGKDNPRTAFPAIQEVGQSKTKFRPATYGLSDTDVASLVSKAVDAFDTEWEKSTTKQLTDVSGMIQNIMSQRPPNMPLEPILWVHACQCFLMEKEAEKDLQEVCKTIQREVVSHMEKERVQYNSYIGESASSQGPLFAIFKKQNVGGREDVKEIFKSLTSLRDMHIVTFRNWLASKFIGMALNHCEPGCPIR